VSRIASAVSVAEGYERWAATYDRDPNPLLAREERHLLALLGSLRGKRVLDLACGTGRWLQLVAEHAGGHGIGIDGSLAMLRVARDKDLSPSLLTQGISAHLPFSDSSFDLAICSFALGHIADLNSTAAELARVLRPGSTLFISDLHPEAFAYGWRVGFRDEANALEIETVLHRADEVIESFCAKGFEHQSQDSLWLGEPERNIFARAGKSSFFSEACEIPAVIVLNFRLTNPPIAFLNTTHVKGRS
jgi:ubiquinone/menaquinone biosynthesis C-methylase UbiE